MTTRGKVMMLKIVETNTFRLPVNHPYPNSFAIITTVAMHGIEASSIITEVTSLSGA